jgi:hypothetical protein
MKTSENIDPATAPVFGEQPAHPPAQVWIGIVPQAFECRHHLRLAFMRRAVRQRVQNLGADIHIRVVRHRDQPIPDAGVVGLDVARTQPFDRPTTHVRVRVGAQDEQSVDLTSLDPLTRHGELYAAA